MKVSELIEKLQQFPQDSEVLLTLDPALSIDEETMAIGEAKDIAKETLYLYESNYDIYPTFRNESDTLEEIELQFDPDDYTEDALEEECRKILESLETKEGGPVMKDLFELDHKGNKAQTIEEIRAKQSAPISSRKEKRFAKLQQNHKQEFRYCKSCGMDMKKVLNIMARIYKRIRKWEECKSSYSATWEQIKRIIRKYGFAHYAEKIAKYKAIPIDSIIDADLAIREMITLRRHFREFGLHRAFPVRAIWDSPGAETLFIDNETCRTCGKPGQIDLFRSK